MKECPFDDPTVWDQDGEPFICDFLDDDTWTCNQEICPYFEEDTSQN